MKLIWSWLTEWLPLSITPQELADRLTQAGFEVESIHSFGEALRGITTARIDRIEPHPNADRLQITTVFDGSNHHTIVTGATNISVGDVVPISIPGSVLASGLTIESRPLRGVPSHGMLCSRSELGVPPVEDGIWILDPSTPLGIDWIQAAVLSDTILDISILPNRGDCMSMWGMAREISVIMDLPLPSLPHSFTAESLPLSANLTSIPEGCSELSLVPIRFNGGGLPMVMQRRLACLDIRLIHPIVDVLHYVMLEGGQPFHVHPHQSGSFRLGQVGDIPPVLLLDGTSRSIPTDALGVWQGDQLGALAGIMGTEVGAIGPHDTDMWIEAAYFDPVTIRRTARSLGLRTDSGVRFERGIDPAMVVHWQHRALHLLSQHLNVQIGDQPLHWKAPDFPTNRVIPFQPERINQLLGTSLSVSSMEGVLSRLGFVVHDTSICIPSWRIHDIQYNACLAEEVARMVGYDHLPTDTTLPMVPQTAPTRLQTMVQQSTIFWQYQGLTETHTFPMVSPDEFLLYRIPPPSDGVQLKNPLSQEQSVLRRYLMPSLMRVVHHQHARQQDAVSIYEIGKVFFETPGGSIRENTVLGVMLTGPMLRQTHTPSTPSEWTFDRLKGVSIEWLTAIGIDATLLEWDVVTYPMYHPTRSADIRLGSSVVGNVGFVHPDIVDTMGIRCPVAYIGVSLTALSRMPLLGIKQAVAPSRYPDMRRDVSFLAPLDLPYSDIDRVIRDHLPQEVVHFELFDRFSGGSIPIHQVSYAMSFTYQSKDRTLSDDEVSLVHQGLCDSLKRTLPIVIRDA